MGQPSFRLLLSASQGQCVGANEEVWQEGGHHGQ